MACILRHQTGAQYSAVEYTRAKAAALAPHPDPASRLIRATHEVSFPRSDSRCLWYVSDLSSFTPRYVGIWMEGQAFSIKRNVELTIASLLFRWKAADTILDQQSFRSQIWRYAASVTRSWLRAPLIACQSLAECIKARLFA